MVADYKLTDEQIKIAYHFCKLNGRLDCPGHDADPDDFWHGCRCCPDVTNNAYLAGVK